MKEFGAARDSAAGRPGAARLTAEGKRVARVRILEEPPTDYQRWLLWASPWHAAAGEDIRYLPRSQAERISLPLVNDWWLLDDERVILMVFTEAGEISGKRLLTDSVAVAPTADGGIWPSAMRPRRNRSPPPSPEGNECTQQTSG